MEEESNRGGLVTELKTVPEKHTEANKQTISKCLEQTNRLFFKTEGQNEFYHNSQSWPYLQSKHTVNLYPDKSVILGCSRDQET